MNERIDNCDAASRVAEILGEFLPKSEVGSLIGGEIVRGAGETVDLVDPSTGEVFLTYQDATAASDALDAASRGQKAWWALTASERGRVMCEIGRLVRNHQDQIAELETRSVGKPIRDARSETTRVAEMFEYYAGWCDKLHGDVIPVPTTHLNYTRHEPYGVVVQLTPWNAPLFTAGWQIAPAIAAGNAVVLKPSELTPLSSLVLGRLCGMAGAPRGLVNVVAGLGRTAGHNLTSSPRARLIVFVGSAATGASIAATAAANLVPCILELGGKSANIVFSDADLKHAIRGTQAAIFAAAGQSCVAGSRLLVHRTVQHRFLAELAQAAGRIPIGPPLDNHTQIGPINNKRQWAKIDKMVQAGIAAGAVLATGGGCPPHLQQSGGFYYAPTILDQVDPATEIAREEAFGPVLAVTAFDHEEEAIQYANGNEYGLAGGVWTSDVGRAHRVAAKINVGTFWINGYKTISPMSPFGGYGRSGYGRSSGKEALLAYTWTKSVWVETGLEPQITFGYPPR